MDRKMVRRLDAALIVAGLVVVAVLFMAATKPGRPVLTVWSCGSNYESMTDMGRRFEEKLNCRVRYTAAPVGYLLELAIQSKTPPDVIVGRGGPGWEALRQEGELARGPVFFALDPYVMITPLGNPADIQSIEDVGREGVRVAASPWAMRPRGKCPAHLMFCVSLQFFPGLEERWESNTTVPMKCGRKLAEPVVAGQVDVAIVPRCMTSWEGVKGKVDVVPIATEHLLALKKCRATIPQCCGIMTRARNPELANEFVDEILHGLGPELFPEHGYIPITAREAELLKSFMQVFIPKDSVGWQVDVAKGLSEDGAHHSALRRWLQIASFFAPGHYQARSRFRAGEVLMTLGQEELARVQWQRLVDEFPRPGKLEWESTVLNVGKPVPGVERLPEAHWVEEGKKALASLGASGSVDAEQARWLSEFPIPHIPIKEGDPDKNGLRAMELGKDEIEAGHYVGATRDLLKVISLSYHSKHMPEARFWIGVVSHLRGLDAVAAKDWRALIAAHGESEWAHAATRALALLGEGASDAGGGPATSVDMPPWEPAYMTHGERGMTYGMMLWEHDLPLYCFKEMVKTLHGIYKKPGPLWAMARYRAGVCCLALGKPEAAHSQWTLLQRCWPTSRWVKRASEAKGTLPDDRRRDLPFVAKYATPEAIEDLKKPAKGGWVKRYRMAEEFLGAGVLEGDQCLLEYWKVMTVTDPSQEKNVEYRPKAELKCGVVLRQAGREDAARRHFERVLSKHPDSEAANAARAALEKGGE